MSHTPRSHEIVPARAERPEGTSLYLSRITAALMFSALAFTPHDSFSAGKQKNMVSTGDAFTTETLAENRMQRDDQEKAEFLKRVNIQTGFPKWDKELPNIILNFEKTHNIKFDFLDIQGAATNDLPPKLGLQPALQITARLSGHIDHINVPILGQQPDGFSVRHLTIMLRTAHSNLEWEEASDELQAAGLRALVRQAIER